MKADLLWREMSEQPAVLTQVLEKEEERTLALARAVRDRRVHVAVIAGRGSSDNAAVYGRYLLEAYSGIVVSLAAPSLFTLYNRPPDLADALVIGVSQSGEAADVLEVLKEGRRQGALTVAITNHERSPLAEAADHVLRCHAGTERSVPATKTVTSTLAVFALLASHLANDGGELRAGLARVPEGCAAALGLAEAIQSLVRPLAGADRWAVLGRGFHLATALETALKIQEMSGAIAQAYSVADFLHGPVGVVDTRAFTRCSSAAQGPAAPLLAQALSTVRERGGSAHLLGDGPSVDGADVALPVALPETLRPIPAVVAGQLFAYSLARRTRYRPGNPRGLRKVTITR